MNHEPAEAFFFLELVDLNRPHRATIFRQRFGGGPAFGRH
jgi:hypothetical protein